MEIWGSGGRGCANKHVRVYEKKRDHLSTIDYIWKKENLRMIEKSDLRPEAVLYNEISDLVEQGHYKVLSQVNSAMTLLFWQVGKRVNDFILEHRRAKYGKEIVVTLSRQLEKRFGRNFEEENLRRMLQFANVFPDTDKVVTLSRHLS